MTARVLRYTYEESPVSRPLKPRAMKRGTELHILNFYPEHARTLIGHLSGSDVRFEVSEKGHVTQISSCCNSSLVRSEGTDVLAAWEIELLYPEDIPTDGWHCSLCGQEHSNVYWRLSPRENLEALFEKSLDMDVLTATLKASELIEELQELRDFVKFRISRFEHHDPLSHIEAMRSLEYWADEVEEYSLFFTIETLSRLCPCCRGVERHPLVCPA